MFQNPRAIFLDGFGRRLDFNGFDEMVIRNVVIGDARSAAVSSKALSKILAQFTATSVVSFASAKSGAIDLVGATLQEKLAANGTRNGLNGALCLGQKLVITFARQSSALDDVAVIRCFETARRGTVATMAPSSIGQFLSTKSASHDVSPRKNQKGERKCYQTGIAE